MLIGIMAKNGILIIEFANQLRDKGQDVHDAILDASTIRLSPVMMTMISTVLGGVPLVLSAGAGAEAREALGWAIGWRAGARHALADAGGLSSAGRFFASQGAEEARLREELDAANAGRVG